MPFSALITTAAEGCHRCVVIRKAIEKWREIQNPDDLVIGINLGGKWRGSPGKVFGLYVGVSRKESWKHVSRLVWSIAPDLGDFELEFELYTTSEKVSTHWDIPLLASVPPNPSPAEYARQAKEWLEHCKTTHGNHCPSTEQELPTRVIDVGNRSQEPKIYESKPGERGQYVALSYCWGVSRAFTTTLATFEDRKTGFALADLPNTIREAALLTRYMGFKYLWADSLCIIQDSSSDWEREAARMCSVYTKAAVTFAAIDSPKSETGLFVVGGRRLVKVESTHGPIFARKHYHGEVGNVHEVLPRGASHLSANVLLSRGWTVQEFLLSSRILWLKGTEMCWSCLCEAACECHPRPSSDFLVSRGTRMEHAIGSLLNLQHSPPGDRTRWLWRWFDLVETYTRRNMTKATDRLPAIAGLAAWLQPFMKARYIFGLWETDNFLKQILWYIHDAALSRNHIPPYGELSSAYAPSWSWASCWGPISMPWLASEGLIVSPPSFSPTTTPPLLPSSSPTFAPDEMVPETPPSPHTPTSRSSRPSIASESFLTHRALNRRTFGKLLDPHHSIWTFSSVSVDLVTMNEFGPGKGAIILHSLLVPLKVYGDLGTKAEASRMGHHDSLSFAYRQKEADAKVHCPLVLFSRDDDPADVWQPDSRNGYSNDESWYNEREIYLVFAELGILKDGENREPIDFCGLVLELLSGDIEGGNKLRKFRRLGYAESNFYQSEDEGEKETELCLEIDARLRRGSWKHWKELGSWETITLV